MLSYQIALFNVFWDEQNIDTRYFDSVNSQTEYFEALTEGLFSPFRNIQWGNGVELSLTYTENAGRSIQEVLHCNYAVIKELDENGIALNYRYYFAYPRHDAGNNYILDLSLDDIQTNYFKYKDTIAPCIINRAHLDRFLDIDNNVKFNFSYDSPFFQVEETDNAKYLYQRSKLMFNWTLYNEVSEWLNKYVAYWVYIFVDKTKDYSVEGGNINIYSYFRGANGTSGSQDYGIVCYPVYKRLAQNEIIRVKINGDTSETQYELDYVSEELFRQLNNDSSYYYSKKISIVPPFGLYTFQYEIDNNNRLVLTTTFPHPQNNLIHILGGVDFSVLGTSTNKKYGILHTLFQEDEPFTCEINQVDKQLILPKFTFENSELSTNNVASNPVLLNPNYIELKLKSFDGSEFDYDFQKLGGNGITFLYSEAIVPTITKYYLRAVPIGVYSTREDSNGGNDTNYLGLVGSVDTTVSVSTDQYASFIANNKNFWLQTITNGLGNMVSSIASGGILNGAAGAMAGAITGGVKLVTGAINATAILDNLENAPDQIKQASGDILFNNLVTELGFFVELKITYPIMLNKTNDYNKLFGFIYGLVGSLNEFDNIRNDYNYLSANIDVISAPISCIEKTRLINKLNSVRFWNSDEINYNKDNIERRYLVNE